MTNSMTGFAARTGANGSFSWSWEIRSVNSKGLDLRLRVPDWVPGLEAALRPRLTTCIARGSVTVNLRLLREEGASALRINDGHLSAIFDALARVEAAAATRGVTLAPARATDILAYRGVLETSGDDTDGATLLAPLLADLDPLLDDFAAMRAAEGAALAGVLRAQIERIEALTDNAAQVAAARRDRMAAAVRAALARVMDAAGSADPQRVAQELALIAIKADVTEELDRLRAHVAAARALLADEAPIGRRLDFLSQEFNREANTLCSKAQDAELATIGLELKTVIDQMREQVQNVE